jgi:hypothetical protein
MEPLFETVPPPRKLRLDLGLGRNLHRCQLRSEQVASAVQGEETQNRSGPMCFVFDVGQAPNSA